MRRPATLLLICAALLLCGCGNKEDSPGLGSQVWEVPALTYGVMACDKLEVLPWDSGRCETTSHSTMLETREGYYLSCREGILLYADKANLSHWVPVCNKPNCAHQSGTSFQCNAAMTSTQFYPQEGRLFYLTGGTNIGLPGRQCLTAVISRDAQGSDLRIEATDTELLKAHSTFLGVTHTIVDRCCFLNLETLEEDGSNKVFSYRLTDNRWEQIGQAQCAQEELKYVRALISGYTYFNGDPLVHNGVIEPDLNIYLRVGADNLEKVDLSGLPLEGGYLSGNTFRFFQTNAGYWDADLETGEKTLLGEAQLENSTADILLPNCVIESTLLTRQSFDRRSPGMTHAMKFFDGSTWYDVTLPEELRNTDDLYLLVKAVTSDSILFLCQRYSGKPEAPRTAEIYALSLSAEAPVLTHTATVARWVDY